MRDTTSEAGMRCRELRHAAEAGKWRLWAKYRGADYHSGRGGGAQVYRYLGDDNYDNDGGVLGRRREIV